MNTRPIRVPNVDPDGYHADRMQRRAIRAEQRAFIESFSRQVAEIMARDKEPRDVDQKTREGDL